MQTRARHRLVVLIEPDARPLVAQGGAISFENVSFHYDADRRILNDVSRTVQSKGYAFNKEYEFPLSRDTDGLITLAPNMLQVDVDDCFHGVDPIARGLALYDRKNHTSIFTADLTATVVILLPWDSLPQAARNYIAIRAARAFAVRMQTGDLTVRATQVEEDQALLALDSLEADTADANFLTDSWSVAQVLLGRET